ncbi:hypothetical protein M0802_013630 [Mischocyttarus mexicanus]|nr:hypothetical protein M0802_013630 [Mischocyttarus mexicanus]
MTEKEQTQESVGIPTSSKYPFIVNQTSVKNLAGWALSPLIQVGALSGNLRNMPSSQDNASLRGCKSQQYTSWDCLSRSYVGGSVIVKNKIQKGVQQKRVRIRNLQVRGDLPTAQELEAFPGPTRRLWRSGDRIFVRDTGKMLTRMQFSKLTAEVGQESCAPYLAAGDAHPGGSAEVFTGGVKTRSATDNPVLENGYYYSDTLPVRVITVANFQSRAEQGASPPYSPLYLSYLGRLSDPAQTGVLGATIRGPNVRDSTAMTALAKAMSRRPGTVYEIAPMVRSACALLSICAENYELDPILLRFVRNVNFNTRNNSIFISQKADFPSSPLLITAMPLDTFTALANNSFYHATVDGFDYAGLDSDWVAVLVSSRMIGQSHLLAYITSWMSSELWAGTVNFRVSGTSRLDDSNNISVNNSYIPSVNSVHIPGPTRVAIVLVDETPDNVGSHLTIRGTDVPIWRGRQVVTPVNIGELWARFWNHNNIAGASRDLLMAHEEICNKLGVENSCDMAASLSAEMYGSLYSGMSLPNIDNTLEPDFGEAPGGSWTYDGSRLDKVGRILSTKFNLDDPQKEQARRRTVGYNFSALTPNHLAPTGIVKSRFTLADGWLHVGWGSLNPLYSTPGYKTSTMSSVYRVGTYFGLINTHSRSHSFNGPSSFAQWMHMLSTAISFSCSAFLGLNDLSPREWTGFDDRYNRNCRSALLSEFKDDIYQGTVVHHDIRDIAQSWPEWDEDLISELTVEEKNIYLNELLGDDSAVEDYASDSDDEDYVPIRDSSEVSDCEVLLFCGKS